MYVCDDALIGLTLVSQRALGAVYPSSSSQVHVFYLEMQNLISQIRNILTLIQGKPNK